MLSADKLAEKAVIAVHKRVQTFVLDETGSGPWGHIFRCDGRDENGSRRKETSLPRRALRIWPTVKGYSDAEVAKWMLPDAYDEMIELLNALFQLAQDPLPSRQRKECVKQLRDRASDFVELLTGEP